MSGLEARRGFVARVFYGRRNALLSLTRKGLSISQDRPEDIVAISRLTEPVGVEQGAVWARLVVESEDGSLLLRGFRPDELQPLADSLNAALKAHTRRRLNKQQEAVKDAAEAITRLLAQDEYARASRVTPVVAAARQASAHQSGTLWDLYATKQQKTDAKTVATFLKKWKKQVAQANREFVAKRTMEFADFFDTVEKSPLTQAQREACVTDEDNNLVLAGAGTGKTSTMVGRAGYLLASGAAKPHEILMLAFAKKAADEMQDRQVDRLADLSRGTAPTVKTFHALGLEVIGEAEGKRPALSLLAEDPLALNRFIDQELERQCVDPGYVADVLTWCFNRRFSYGNPFDFASEQEYLEYVRTNELRTLNGERVKSYEELVVANFLLTNGVVYEYERKYVIPDSFRDSDPGSSPKYDRGYICDQHYRPYMPDFYLPDYDIYLEHFALNQNLEPPVGWAGYAEGVIWKRETHERYGTRLLETRSHMQFDGVLEECLTAILRTAGVRLEPKPMEEMLEELREKGDLKYVTQPIAQFLGLLKQSDYELGELRTIADKLPEADRFELFFVLFEPIFRAYEVHLTENHEIDFSDMIRRAIEHVEAGRFRSPYAHVLVDEFQDISSLRGRFVRGLVGQHKESVLFAVGDDWQAIYRFTGSDLGLTRHFGETFGPTAVTALDTTFRFNDRIGSVASSFILRNPEQIEKEIASVITAHKPAVSLLPTSDPVVGLDLALGAIEGLLEPDGKSDATILVLGRYNFTTEPWGARERRRIKEEHPRLHVDFMTVHGAKGREADYVVVLGVEMGRNGFPAEKPTEPLMELLLPTLENYPFAEERRLFYVALTRARHRVYVMYEPTIASRFVEELAERDAEDHLLYDICTDEFLGVQGALPHNQRVGCPECCTGGLSKKTGKYGEFVGCNRFPYCTYTEPPCPQCGSVMERLDGMRVCTNDVCDEQSPVCPKCGAGMVRRSGPYGSFWGCLNYRPSAINFCSHTINIGSPYRKSRKYGYGQN